MNQNMEAWPGSVENYDAEKEPEKVRGSENSL